MMKKQIYGVLVVAIICVGLVWFFESDRLKPIDIEKATKRLGKPAPSGSQPLSKAEVLAESRQIVDALKKRRSSKQGALSKQKPILGLKRGYGHQVPNPKQQQAINDVLTKLPDSTVLHMDNFQRTLRHLRGDLSELANGSQQYQQAKASGDFTDMAFALLSVLADVTGIQSPEDSFKITKVSTDKIGLTHISLAQQIEGIPVWGADMKVHLNANSEPIEVSGIYSPVPKKEFWPEQPISEIDAVANALAELQQQTAPTDTTVEKIAYWNPNTKPHPCYQVSVSPAMDESYFVFVSAIDGKVLRVYDRIISSSAATGSAQDLQGVIRQFNSYQSDGYYFAVDTSLAMYNSTSSLPPDYDTTFGGLSIYSEDNGSFDDVLSTSANDWPSDAVSAQYNMRLAYEYFQNVHGRISFDDASSSIGVIINYSNQYENAFWTAGGKYFAYGDGDTTYSSLAGALDICAHEYTHAVVTYTANLKYETQSGALNEHFADLFAAMVDRDDWLIGEDIALQSIAMRDMQNPANPLMPPSYHQPSTMYEYVYWPNTKDGDWGGVHMNNGILNRMAYLLSDETPSIGKDKLEALAYHALNNYLVQYSQFIDYRRAMVSAAQDIYGWGSFEEDAVKVAFNSVAVFDDEATPDPVTYNGSGNEEVVFLYADEDVYNSNTDSPYLVGVHRADGNFIVSSRYAKKTRPWVSGDAMELAFLDVNGDLCFIDEEGEEIIDFGAEIKSFSMSKDGRYFVLAYPDTSSVVLYDFVADTMDTVGLMIANPDGEDTSLRNPDIMTFSPSGDRLVFDATSKLRFSDGNEYDVWGVYSMRIADKRVVPVWQPSQEAMFGNPHFSNLHPDMIVADMVDLNMDEGRAISINIWHQQGFALTAFDESTAFPSFSGLDNDLIYIEKGWIYNNLYSTAFMGSDFGSVSTSKTELYEQSDPIAYPVGYADNPSYTAPKAQISTVSNLDFPDTVEGHVYEIEVPIVNAGSAMLEMYDMHLVGSNTNEFSFITPVSLISPGSSLGIKVRFKPSSAGEKTAMLKIFSTAPDQKETTVYLSGTAISADSDFDGLLDSWEMENFGNLDSVANDDNDSDGLSNWEEFIANTHPTNAQSSLRIDSLEFVGGNLHIIWHGGTGVLQRILTADALINEWRPIFTNNPPTPVTNEYLTPMNDSNVFFKVEAGSF